MFVLLFCIQSLVAQDPKNKKWADEYDNYTAHPKTSIADKTQAEHIVTCLANYHTERMLGLAFTGVAVSLAVGSTQINEKDSKDGIYIASGVFALVSFIIYIDAEKWISRNRLSFTGDKLAYRF